MAVDFSSANVFFRNFKVQYFTNPRQTLNSTKTNLLFMYLCFASKTDAFQPWAANRLFIPLINK